MFDRSSLVTVGLLVSGMALGIAVQHLFRLVTTRRERSSMPNLNRRVQRILQYTVIMGVNPVVFVGVVWTMPLDRFSIAALPIFGLAALVLGGVLAFYLGRLRGLDRPRLGTQLVSGWFTSLGSIGTLVCYQLLGEPGIMLLPTYRLLEEISYYGVAFPLVRRIRDDSVGLEPVAARLRRVVREPVFLVFGASISLGLILNAAAFPRPQLYGSVIEVLVPAGSFTFLVSIGMTMKFSSFRRHWRYSLDIVFVKHVVVPLCIVGLATIFGFVPGTDGIWEVTLVLASMPVGLLAVGFSTLLDLDVDLANSNWLASNAALVVVIPLLSWIIGTV